MPKPKRCLNDVKREQDEFEGSEDDNSEQYDYEEPNPEDR